MTHVGEGQCLCSWKPALLHLLLLSNQLPASHRPSNTSHNYSEAMATGSLQWAAQDD